MPGNDLFEGLPGEELVRRGLSDLAAGITSIPACLAGMARPRLSRAGLLPGRPAGPEFYPESELELYRLLRQQGGDAYSRYRSLLRELVSFEQAFDRRWRQHLEAAHPPSDSL